MTTGQILRLLAPLCAAALAGCVTTTDPDTGGTGFPPDPDATGTIALGAVSVEAAAREAASLTGEVDQATGTFTLGTQSGTLSDDGTGGTLDGGGVLIFEAGGTEFAVLYELTPAGAGQTTGIVGIPTETADLNALGEVNYAGTATLLIEDGNAIYDLSGDATIEASFDTGTVTATLDGLSGEREAGLASPPASVSEVGVITVTGSAIEGATFSGGTPALVSDEISDLSGSETLSLEGAFYGPDADELGASLVIDDSVSGSVTILGTIIAD